MIPRKLDEITEAELDLIVENAVVERKQREYKRDLPAKNDEARKEFLKDVSSFANTDGGDIIFGVEEKNGIPVALPGVPVTNEDEDKEMLRFENIIRDGITPRVGYATQFVRRDGKPPVYIIRIDRSWNPPHRVEFKDHHKYYARATNGKYEMDVDQLRAAFTFSSSIADRIRAFRAERLSRIENDRTVVRLSNKSRLVLHLIPYGSLVSPSPSYPLPDASRRQQMVPMFLEPGNFSARINLDGFFTHDGNRQSPSNRYTQLYRNGIVESVDSWILNFPDSRGLRQLFMNDIEEKVLLQHIPAMLKIQADLGVVPPVALALTLTQSNGLALPSPLSFINDVVAENDLVLPEVVLDSFQSRIDTVIRPIADLIWNAAGKEGSPNFDAEGKWRRTN